MVYQAPSEIVDPPLRRSTHICKSTKSPDFAYSCYSSSYTSFLAYIRCLSKPSSYKETILDLRWQQAMDEELKALHEIDPLLLGKSVVGCHWVYILMNLLSDLKLGWLQKDIHNNTI